MTHRSTVVTPVWNPSLPPHLLTQRLQVQGLQFLGHLSPPVAEPAVKVGRLEEMPWDADKTTRHTQDYDDHLLELFFGSFSSALPADVTLKAFKD